MRDELVDPKPMTAGLFFSREFYLRYQPELRLSAAAMRSPAGRDYVGTLRNPMESGTEYGFLAFKEDLRWYPLLPTNVGEDHYYFGSIRGDLIFHLGSAASESRGFPGMREHSWVRHVRQEASLLMPRGLRRAFKVLIPQQFLFPESPAHQRAYSTVKEALIADPEGYLQYLRTGRH
jgi:hypothetical protein